MITRASTPSGLASAFALALSAAGCVGTVIVPDEAAGVGGTAGGGTAGAAGSTTTSTPTTVEECADSCSILPESQTCKCARTCSGSFIGKAACAPIVDLQGTAKVECVCTVGDTFSGVCFEKNDAALCDFDDGCCAKYFSGK